MSARAPELSRRVARPVGFVLAGLAALMLLCGVIAPPLAALEAELTEQDRWGGVALAISAALTGLIGAALWVHGRPAAGLAMGRRDATFTVALVWTSIGVLGALPFLIGARFTPADALFEAVSGFTTTGSTILVDIEAQPRPLLLWRALMQWLGGMGIVVLFVAIFPALGVGARHMYRGEMSGVSVEGVQPRITDTALVLWRLYMGLTVLAILALWALGMGPFDAVAHGLTTIATGGYSTRNASIAHFDSAAIEAVITVFILASGTSYAVYYAMLQRRSLREALRSPEFKVYWTIVLVSILAMALLILPTHDWNPLLALRYGSFQVATFITSTGYGSDDYSAYPAAAIMLIVFLMFMGGSSGSTSGGFKVVRIALLARMTWAQVRRFFRPSVVTVVRFGRKPMNESLLADVGALFFLWVATIAVLTALVALIDGVPVPTAFGASLSAVSNMGPAPFHLEDDNFAAYTDVSKLLFAVGMVLGRLEFFTLLALLLPDFWRR